MKSLGDFFRRLIRGTSANKPEAVQTRGQVERSQEQSRMRVQQVNIGLDFGTSTTKVIARLDRPGGSQGEFHILAPPDSSGSVLFPSTIALDESTLLFGAAAEKSPSVAKARSFKMNLPIEAGLQIENWRQRFRLGDTGLSAEDATTLYLAWVLNQSQCRLKELLGGAGQECTVNAAAPLDQLNRDPKLISLFHRIMFRGLRLAPSAKMPWRLSDARACLEQIAQLPVPEATESPITVIPETHAAMTAYMLRPGQEKGLFACVDVGAGTTDVAFFWFHSTDGIPEACYYGARSGYVGLDDIDFSLGEKHAMSPGDVRRQREQRQIKIDIQNRKTCEVLGRIYKEYSRGFGAAYDRCRGEARWVDSAGHAKYILCLIGGGAVVPEVTRELRKALPHLRMSGVLVDQPEIPGNLPVVLGPSRRLPVNRVAPYEQPLLLLAYGLAHRPVDIPIYDPDAEFSVHQVIAELPDRDERYAR